MKQNTRYTNEIDPNIDENKTINLSGWVHEIRNLGGISFLILRDREGFAQITIVKKKTDKLILETLENIVRESVISVTGIVKIEKKVKSGYEIIPISLNILNKSDVPLPMDTTGKIDAELDTRLDSRYLDLRRIRTLTIFKIRSIILDIIRNYFKNLKFIETTTPKIVAAATEGGTELFPITYFEKTAFLNQSPQLFKQILMSGGLDRVFEIGPIFRAEEHNTRRHLNEATSIDAEVSFSNDEDVMIILENLIFEIYSKLNNEYKHLLEKIDINLIVPKVPFKRYTYSYVINILNNQNKKDDEYIQWGNDLTTKNENDFGKYVFETTGEEHYFITEWPSDIKPFYVMKNEINNKLSKSFDLMHITMELSSGAQRCHDYNELCSQIKEKGLLVDDFDFYLNSFRYGMPPHSGFGVGLERLLMTILKIQNIRETVLFPRDKIRLSP